LGLNINSTQLAGEPRLRGNTIYINLLLLRLKTIFHVRIQIQLNRGQHKRPSLFIPFMELTPIKSFNTNKSKLFPGFTLKTLSAYTFNREEFPDACIGWASFLNLCFIRTWT